MLGDVHGSNVGICWKNIREGKDFVCTLVTCITIFIYIINHNKRGVSYNGGSLPFRVGYLLPSREVPCPLGSVTFSQLRRFPGRVLILTPPSIHPPCEDACSSQFFIVMKNQNNRMFGGNIKFSIKFLDNLL